MVTRISRGYTKGRRRWRNEGQIGNVGTRRGE